MEDNFSTQLSDNGAAEQRRAGLIDYSDAIDSELQAKERARNKRNAGKSGMGDFMNAQNLDNSLEYVRANPMQAIGVAAGVGLLLGWLMKGR